MKILFYDIETAPLLGYAWELYDTNIIHVKKDWELLSFAYKWQGDSTTKCFTRLQYKDKTDKSLVAELWRIMNEADVIVAHYGDGFDIKKSNAKFLEHGFNPPAPSATIDTKKIASRRFKLTSNKLDDIAKLLGVGRKMKHSGFEMWLGCMAGKRNSFKEMAMYNKHDVVILEKCYNKLLPWINDHPSVSLMKHGDKGACDKCGSKNVSKNGFRYRNATVLQKMVCHDCGGPFLCSIKKEKKV